jgi:hypothetical protein
MEQTTMTEWAKEESERMENEHRQAWEEKDYKPFLKLPEGETPLQFAGTPPRKHPKMNGKAIFRVSHEGGDYDLAVREKSPLYRELVAALSKGGRNLTITRTGKGRTDTKYGVKME